MASFKFELNRAGVRELLKSDGVRDMLTEKTAEVAERCGEGYKAKVFNAGTRYVGKIRPATMAAKIDNNTSNTILRNLK